MYEKKPSYYFYMYILTLLILQQPTDIMSLYFGTSEPQLGDRKESYAPSANILECKMMMNTLQNVCHTTVHF